MPWHARLSLTTRWKAGRSVARFEHDGPLRILQSLYPEGDEVCHNVLVHPPGGLVGGDTLDIDVRGASGTHGLITTPGASRFYRSPAKWRCNAHTFSWRPARAGMAAAGGPVLQRLPGAEPPAHGPGARRGAAGLGRHRPGPAAAGQPFERGSLLQHIEVPGAWLERGRIERRRHRLMDGPLGLAGHRCLATLFFVAGEPLARPRRERALELARTLIGDSPLDATSGATSPNPQVVVVRVLAPVVEPAMALLRGVWAAWRENFWSKSASSPRGWST
jgi:urease accessory protein